MGKSLGDSLCLKEAATADVTEPLMPEDQIFFCEDDGFRCRGGYRSRKGRRLGFVMIEAVDAIDLLGHAEDWFAREDGGEGALAVSKGDSVL